MLDLERHGSAHPTRRRSCSASENTNTQIKDSGAPTLSDTGEVTFKKWNNPYDTYTRESLRGNSDPPGDENPKPIKTLILIQHQFCSFYFTSDLLMCARVYKKFRVRFP